MERETAGGDEADTWVEDPPRPAQPPSEVDQNTLDLTALMHGEDGWERAASRRICLRPLRLQRGASAGLALATLEAVREELNPPPRLLDDEGHERMASASDRMQWMSSHSYSLFSWRGSRAWMRLTHAVIDRRVGDLRDARGTPAARPPASGQSPPAPSRSPRSRGSLRQVVEQFTVA